MKLELDLIDFLEFATYNQLFNYVDLPRKMCEALTSAHASHCRKANSLSEVEMLIPDFHIEESLNNIWRVWYPIKSWIDECKRRKELENLSIDWKKNYKPTHSLTNLQRQLIAAVTANKTAEIIRITKLIEEQNKK